MKLHRHAPGALILALLFVSGTVSWAQQNPRAPFVITIVDDQTGRGVPLVENGLPPGTVG